MTAIQRLTKIGNVVLRFVTILLAVSMCTYSAYALYDSYYTNKQAFTSWDLQQYKPVPVEEGDDGESFDELLELNGAVVGWLTMSGTNIDYPVVQGANDLEYAGKDIYGHPSITGSIYLAYQNSRTFSDQYNIIYGHHMDNGAMFGDLDKYVDAGFFESNTEGFLMTPSANYALHVFACLQTDAYNTQIYSVLRNNRYDQSTLLNYIRENALHFREPGGAGKIIALSTCAAFQTDGRLVIFATATEAEEIPDPEPPTGLDIRKAVGHGHGAAWALLNLICVVMTMYSWLPLFRLKRKYSRKKTAKQWVTEHNEAEEGSAEREIVKDLKRFIKKFNWGLVVEPVIFIGSVIAFILTENIFTPMILIDKWTPLMLAIYALAIFADIILFTYRGQQPSTDESENNSD